MSEPVKGAKGPQRGYEGSDVSVKQLFFFAAGVVGLVVFGVVASALTFHYIVRHQSLGPPATPFENARTLPPEPRLQVHAPLDLQRYRTEQEKILDGYGWVDPHGGIVRIPIDRAMELMLAKGYPVRSSSPAESGPAKMGQPRHPPNHQSASTPLGAEGEQ